MGKWIQDHLGWLIIGGLFISAGYANWRSQVNDTRPPTPSPTLDYRDYGPSDSEIEDMQQQIFEERRGTEDARQSEAQSDIFMEGLAEDCSCDQNEYNCAEFDKEYIAQICYDRCLNQVGYDVHRLDEDNDGDACEALP
jgi:hypothetical protein